MGLVCFPEFCFYYRNIRGNPSTLREPTLPLFADGVDGRLGIVRPQAETEARQSLS